MHKTNNEFDIVNFQIHKLSFNYEFNKQRHKNVTI